MAAVTGWIPRFSLGDVANVGQLTGINAVQLISMIVQAANNARMHKKNCRQFAHHLKLISKLLEQLNITDLKERPETGEPLELFEESLRKALVLIESCRDKSYLYLLAMGWTYVNKFRDYQDESCPASYRNAIQAYRSHRHCGMRTRCCGKNSSANGLGLLQFKFTSHFQRNLLQHAFFKPWVYLR